MSSRKRVIKNRSGNSSLENLFDEYQVKNKVRNLSASTIKGYQEGYDRFTGVVGHDLTADGVSSTTVDRFTLALMEEGLRTASINHYLRCVRSFLYWCMDEEFIGRFKIRMLKEQESVKPTYTDEQIRLLVHEPRRDALYTEWRCWAMACWFLGTGNRAETACSVRLGDVSFQDREIRINRTKTHQAIVLPLSDELATVLRKFISMFRDVDKPEEYLFPSVGNTKLTVNALKISMRQYNQRRSVTMTGLHAYRHTFAKNWIRNTGDVFRLQKILGHKTLEMTRRYVNMFAEDLKDGYESFCPLDTIKRPGGNATKNIHPPHR